MLQASCVCDGKAFLYMFNNNYSQITPKRLMRRELLSFIDITTEIWHSCIINKQRKIRRINVQSVPYDALNKLWGTFILCYRSSHGKILLLNYIDGRGSLSNFFHAFQIIFASWIINVGRHTAAFKVKISDLFFTSQNASPSSNFPKFSA